MIYKFENCTGLTSVIITGNGEWKTWLGGLDAHQVKTLKVGSEITELGGFQMNPASVSSYAKVPPACSDNTFTAYDAELHVPSASSIAYFTASGWKNFYITNDLTEYVTMSQTETESIVGDMLQLKATTIPANKAEEVVWSTSNPAVATVDSVGRVTVHAKGECRIFASLASDLTVYASCHMSAKSIGSGIKLDKTNATISPNEILTLIPTYDSADVPDITATTSDASVALARVVTINGTKHVQVLGVNYGIATITVASVDGNVPPAVCQITVRDAVSGGDINGDGKVDVEDVNEIINSILFPSNYSRIQTYVVNGVTFDMVRVAGGTFNMGGTDEQGSDATNLEKPVHKVTLSNYSIGVTEVTQELWNAVMGNDPSEYNDNLQCPVECVSYDDCLEFIERLNEITKMSFRMPTEAEWEYAARGGNQSEKHKYSGDDEVLNVAWCSTNSERTHTVAQKNANELGLYDMSGNVWEWCSDWYGAYSAESQTNPKGPETGTFRVCRGGGWHSSVGNCRTSSRTYNAPTAATNRIGLRLAK